MFKIGEVEIKACAGASHGKQCDLAARLTEEMNKYPKGSPERNLLKATRFSVAYGKSDGTINNPTDFSLEEMMARFNTMFKQEE